MDDRIPKMGWSVEAVVPTACVERMPVVPTACPEQKAVGTTASTTAVRFPSVPCLPSSVLPASRSPLTTDLIDPLSDPDWDRLVSSHPDATIFHSSAWAKVLASTYRHEPYYLRCLRDRKLAALVPVMDVQSRFTGRRGVCLPFSDFCDPLVFEEDSTVSLSEILSKRACERDWKYFQLRGGAAFEKAPRPSASFHGHILDISVGANVCFARFSSSVRRAIRKGERTGLEVELSRSREAMMDFYRLHIRTRRRHGLPPQPWSFFASIAREIVQPGNGFVSLARRGTRPVAAAVFLQFGKNAIFKFGASDERFFNLRGNNLVIWEAIKRLAEQGCRTLHFGRTSLENHGLRRFKLGWGTTEERIDYFKFDTAIGDWMSTPEFSNGFHMGLFRVLPSALSRLVGELIYPHVD